MAKKAADKRILLVVNPISGTLPKEGLGLKVREKLEPAGFTVDEAHTTHAGHGAELAREAAAKGYYAVIAAGGDGTVNEIASALCHTDTALGILPYGSGNGLGRHLYGSIDVDHALDIIAKDSVSDCDYGTVNGRPFFCTFGVGFDAKVSKDFAEMPSRGLPTYVKSAMHEWLKYTPSEYEITTDTGTLKVRAFLVAVCNASQYGNNAFIAPTACVHDGLLDIIIVHADNPLSQAFVVVELFVGRLDKNMFIQTLKTSRATIRHCPAPAHIDGEPCDMPEHMEVECVKGDLKIFTDPEKPPFRAYVTPATALRSDSRFLIKERLKHLYRQLKKLLKRLFGKKSDKNKGQKADNS